MAAFVLAHLVAPSVCGWKCGGHKEFCPHESLKFMPKDECELCVLVQDDGIWDSTKSDDFF